MDVTVFENK